MEIRANKLKNLKIPEKGKLYEIRDSRDIEVMENHEDGSKDVVILKYCIEAEAVGYFAKEYLPDGTKKEGAKRIDVTAVMLDDTKKYIRWYLYDLKATVAGASTIVKLYNQWHIGLRYLQQNILMQRINYTVDSNLGVITRNYDRARMERLEREYQKICDDIQNGDREQSLSMRKRRPEIVKYKAVLMASHAILKKEFCAENGDTYTIDIKYLCGQDNMVYQMAMKI